MVEYGGLRDWSVLWQQHFFELEVNEFCDGFPVINSEVAGKLFSTFEGSDSYGLLMNLVITTLAMEELRAIDLDDAGYSYGAF